MFNLKDFSVPLFPRKRLSKRLPLINCCWAPAKCWKFYMQRENTSPSTCPCLFCSVLQSILQTYGPSFKPESTILLSIFPSPSHRLTSEAPAAEAGVAHLSPSTTLLFAMQQTRSPQPLNATERLLPLPLSLLCLFLPEKSTQHRCSLPPFSQSLLNLLFIIVATWNTGSLIIL